MKNAIKVLCFVIAFVLIGTAGTYFWFTFDKGEFEYVEGDEKGNVVITNYIGSEKDVTIPKRLRLKNVTAIDEDAFKESDIESVKIGGNITFIGQNAFRSCKKLKSVELAEGVKSIGEGAFMECTSLKSIKFPSTLKKIDICPFTKSALTEIDMSENDYFTIENGVVYDKDKTVVYFSLESADLSDYKLPETVNMIKEAAFYNHKELTSIEIGSKVTKISNLAFFATGIKEVRIPPNVVSFGSMVFSESPLTRIYISEGTKTIEKAAFEGLEKQLTIVTPENSKAAKYAQENKLKVEFEK